jgi:cyclic pyranopterin phosphate synthase
MEALVAAGAACLALYDMTKSADRGAAVREIVLLEKSGGRSGTWRRGASPRTLT